MLVLGMDPGSLRFGVGILEKEGKQIRYVHSQVLTLGGGDFYSRMQKLWTGLGRLFDAYAVGEAAMEEGFLGKNVRSQTILAMVRGVAAAALISRAGRLSFYAPRQVKQSLTGYGNADKSQVQRMVGLLLKPPRPMVGCDESDALAVAYCHAQSLP